MNDDQNKEPSLHPFCHQRHGLWGSTWAAMGQVFPSSPIRGGGVGEKTGCLMHSVADMPAPVPIPVRLCRQEKFCDAGQCKACTGEKTKRKAPNIFRKSTKCLKHSRKFVILSTVVVFPFNATSFPL